MEELRRAAEAHDSAAVIALFSPDIIVRSPITQLIRFEGDPGDVCYPQGPGRRRHARNITATIFAVMTKYFISTA